MFLSEEMRPATMTMTASLTVNSHTNSQTRPYGYGRVLFLYGMLNYYLCPADAHIGRGNGWHALIHYQGSPQLAVGNIGILIYTLTQYIPPQNHFPAKNDLTFIPVLRHYDRQNIEYRGTPQLAAGRLDHPQPQGNPQLAVGRLDHPQPQGNPQLAAGRLDHPQPQGTPQLASGKLDHPESQGSPQLAVGKIDTTAARIICRD
jgi:hypothetical protein